MNMIINTMIVFALVVVSLYGYTAVLLFGWSVNQAKERATVKSGFFVCAAK